jgi:hypothetical protein
MCKVTAVSKAGVVFMMQDLLTSVSGHVISDLKKGSHEVKGEVGKMGGRYNICRTLV